jgi:hypothetical protein
LTSLRKCPAQHKIQTWWGWKLVRCERGGRQVGVSCMGAHRAVTTWTVHVRHAQVTGGPAQLLIGGARWPSPLHRQASAPSRAVHPAAAAVAPALKYTAHKPNHYVLQPDRQWGGIRCDCVTAACIAVRRS